MCCCNRRKEVVLLSWETRALALVQVSLVMLTAEQRLALTCTGPSVLQSWPVAQLAISALDSNKQFSQCSLDPTCSTSTILVLPPIPHFILSICLCPAQQHPRYSVLLTLSHPAGTDVKLMACTFPDMTVLTRSSSSSFSSSSEILQLWFPATSCIRSYVSAFSTSIKSR